MVCGEKKNSSGLMPKDDELAMQNSVDGLGRKNVDDGRKLPAEGGKKKKRKGKKRAGRSFGGERCVRTKLGATR